MPFQAGVKRGLSRTVNSEQSSRGSAWDAARESAEAKLQTSELRLRWLLESARDYAIFSTDPQRRVDYWNVGAERLFGYRDQQIIGLSADVIFTPEDRAGGAPDKEASDALKYGRAEDERWHQRSDGSRFFASGIMAPLRSPDGTLIGFVKIARDLTERKLADERLHQAHEELERRVQERTAELDVANEDLRIANEQLRVEMEQRHVAETLRREAVRRISMVQEEERRSLSRELHDELGQCCAALLLELSLLELKSGDQAARVKELRRLAETISAEVHSVAVQLRPTALDDIGLEGALVSYVEMWSHRTGIPVELHTSGLSGDRLPLAMELVIYRIIEEALTNVMKHAQAKLVSIVVDRRPEEVRAVIDDDGRGFDHDAVATKPPRLGLLGMNERAAEFAGVVTVESAPGRGTSVYVRLPAPKR